jgi:hypothetical protein
MIPDTIMSTPVAVADAHLLSGSWYEALRQSIQHRHLGAISREAPSKETLVRAKRQQEPQMHPEVRQALEVQVVL